MARLYANENFPRQVVERLRELGHDVLTTQDAGRAGQAVPDPDVLAFAAQNQRAVLTINRRDFIRLHARDSDHAGTIVCTQDLQFMAQAERIDEAIHRSAGGLAGCLLRVNRPGCGRQAAIVECLQDRPGAPLAAAGITAGRASSGHP